MEENGPGAHKFPRGQRVVSVLWPSRSDPTLDHGKAMGTYQQYLAVQEDLLVSSQCWRQGLPLLGRNCAA